MHCPRTARPRPSCGREGGFANVESWEAWRCGRMTFVQGRCEARRNVLENMAGSYVQSRGGGRSIESLKRRGGSSALVLKFGGTSARRAEVRRGDLMTRFLQFTFILSTPHKNGLGAASTMCGRYVLALVSSFFHAILSQVSLVEHGVWGKSIHFTRLCSTSAFFPRRALDFSLTAYRVLYI